MDADLDRTLAFTLREEGGFVDDRQDPGGATNLGVTLADLCSWLKRPATIADVEALTPAAVRPFYLARYWNPSHARDCPAGVGLMVFEEAVNQGVARAIESLQAALGVAVDGDFGPATRFAVRTADPGDLILRIAADREAHYRALPTFGHFGRGWLARLGRARAAALAMESAPAAP